MEYDINNDYSSIEFYNRRLFINGNPTDESPLYVFTFDKHIEFNSISTIIFDDDAINTYKNSNKPNSEYVLLLYKSSDYIDLIDRSKLLYKYDNYDVYIIKTEYFDKYLSHKYINNNINMIIGVEYYSNEKYINSILPLYSTVFFNGRNSIIQLCDNYPYILMKINDNPLLLITYIISLTISMITIIIVLLPTLIILAISGWDSIFINKYQVLFWYMFIPSVVSIMLHPFVYKKSLINAKDYIGKQNVV